jgi:hypothetical protein
MSTDFAIRPVSASAPTAVVRDVSPSRHDAPAETRVRHAPAPQADPAPARQEIEAAEAAFARETVFDKAAGELIFRVVDTRSDRIVRQIPEQAMLRLRAYTRALDDLTEAAQTPGSLQVPTPRVV